MTPKNVLLLDDDANHLKLVAATLNKAACDVHAFRSDAAALKFLETDAEVHAVIFDFQLRGKDISDFSLHLMRDRAFEKYREVYKILCSNLTISQLQYFDNHRLVEYNDYVFKNTGYTQNLVQKLNNHFGDKTPADILERIAAEESRDLQLHDYMYFPAFKKEAAVKSLNIEMSERGIRSFVVALNEPVGLADIEIWLALLPVAFLERHKAELSQAQKASILGINRMKYNRLVKQLNGLRDEKIKKVLKESLGQDERVTGKT